MKYFFSVLMLALLIACSESGDASGETETNTEQNSVEKRQPEAGKITYTTIYIGDIGWGYQVFKGSKLVIDQQNVPAVNGLFGFETEAHAEIAAQFVVEKMKQGWDKPTVSPAELDSIGAINLDSLNQISVKP